MYSCGSKPTQKSKSTTPPANSQTAIIQLDNIQLNVPEGWEKVTPTSSMRVAQMNLKSDPSIQMTVFFFGEQDMIQQNIDRWKGQFTQLTEFTELSSQKPEVSAVKILGTFKQKARPMASDFTEAPGYGTLAAIVPSKSGPYYIKLSAPEAIILSQENGFMQMLDSYSSN